MIAALIFSQLALPALPLPYLEMCADRRDGSCFVRSLTPEELSTLHQVITTSIATADARDADDPWRVFPRDKDGNLRGDCDDQVATERAVLLALGIPAKDLAIETGRVRNADGSEDGHVVLIVTLEGRRWVLDRRVPAGAYEASRRPKDYRTTTVQDPGALLWRPPG